MSIKLIYNYLIDLILIYLMYSKQVERNILYVTELPLETSESDLKSFFSKYADNIANIAFKKPGTAIIYFRDSSVANKVKYEFNLVMLGNHPIRIMWLETNFKELAYNSDSNNIFVNNIPLEVTPREFFVIFSQFGEIVSAKLKEMNGKHIGYGFINYEKSESAEKAIKMCNGKAIFSEYPRNIIETDYFRLLNQREDKSNYMNYINSGSNRMYETKCSLFIKNISKTLKEDHIKSILSDFGKINYFKPVFDFDSSLKSCIVSYDNEHSSDMAEKKLNNKDIDGTRLCVERLRDDKGKRIANDQNKSISNTSKIFIKNVPLTIKEEEIRNQFEKFGHIVNIIMLQSNIMKREENTFKEVSVFTGTVQILYDSQKSALDAIEAMNGKYLPKHESWKNPLYVCLFKTKQERMMEESMQYNPRINRNFNSYNQIPYNQYNNQYQQYQQIKQTYPPVNTNFPQQQINQTYPKQQNPNKFEMIETFNQLNINQHQPKKQQEVLKQNPNFKQIDMLLFNSIIDEEQKREYLGELIYSNICVHPLVDSDNISADEVGKITGMILGIENINEVLVPCNDYNELTLRIIEALKLLRG